MTHPYKALPTSAFWSRSISENWNALSLSRTPAFVRQDDKIASLGSCFAANIIPYIRNAGLTYIQKELRHSAFDDTPSENFAYEKFSARYGNIYTPRQFRQLLDRSCGDFSPTEDRWIQENEIIDPFRPGLKYRARCEKEFELLTDRHLCAVREVFAEASVVIFTLGLTEAWLSSVDGAVFPACPGTVAGAFDPSKHVFHNFTYQEICSDLNEIFLKLRKLNPNARLVLTVSPVPLVATATNNHVLEASTYSKAVLRAACGELSELFADVHYFPAYEIVTGPQAPKEYFESDRRNVSKIGVEAVMAAFLASCNLQTRNHETLIQSGTPDPKMLSRNLADAECEEAASGL